LGNSTTLTKPRLTQEQIRERLSGLGKWFHNLDLNGVQTAPDHFLHDYPASKFKRFEKALPTDLTGKTVLDIGCNGGFYSLEMKRRGAERVLGLDFDERYLEQARFAAEVNQLDIEFRKMSVYDVGSLGEKFDLVIFMGVFYHLRHPLLALDLLHETVVKDMLLFQSMQRGTENIRRVEDDYPFEETGIFDDHSFPLMYFIEKRYAHDPTNWWIPNRAAVEAMLRSSGFEVTDHAESEVFICRRTELPDNMPRAVYPERGGAE
jgi:tRNA (mo5U34)-methyltransferase